MTKAAVRRSAVALEALIIALFPFCGAPAARAADIDITVDGGQRLQTMTSLGVNINPNSWDNGKLKPALDLLIDQGGVQTFRVAMDMIDWEATNDDGDPMHFNWDYYDPIYSGATTFDTQYAGSNFANTWETIDYLHERGIPDSRIMLSFMGPGPAWMGGNTLRPAMEDEYVEEVLSAAYYGYSHGHTFGLLSPDNEEDITANEGITMSDTLYADAMDRLAARMDALGMTNVQLTGPETACCFDVTAMTGHPTLMAKVQHFDLHDYTGSAQGAADDVAGTGRDFWVSEYNAFDQSFPLLDQGASGLMVWEGYDSVYNHAILNGLGSDPGNDSYGNTALLAYHPATQTYTPRSQFYEFAQLFKFVPVGAAHVAATSSNSSVDVEAFADAASSRLTVVGENNSSAPQTLTLALTNLGTLPGSLQYYETNSDSDLARGADVAVAAGSATVTVPADTVFTLTGLGAADVEPPSAPTELTATGGAGTADLTWTAATDNVGVVGYAVYRSTVSGFSPDSANRIGETASTSFTDTGLGAGAYYYRVTAEDAAGNTGPASDEAGATVISVSGGGLLLLGSKAVQDMADSNPAGEAEAFAFTALATGDARTLGFYVDSGSAATNLAVGLYSDAGGAPGALLADGSIDAPTAGAWNTVALGADPTLSSGSTYWIGLLGTGGRLNYRDGAAGSCSESAAPSGIAALPAIWSTGVLWPTCDLSAYVSSAAEPPGIALDPIVPAH